VRFAGVPKLTVNQTTNFQNANLTADVYDVDSGATPRSSAAAPTCSGHRHDLFRPLRRRLVLPAAHRIGVLIGSSNSEWWTPTPTFQPVTVNSANITLGFLSCARPSSFQGDPSIKLDKLQGRTRPSRSTRRRSSRHGPAFPVPPALTSCGL